MSELLLELFCEEIPARMQAKAEADLGEALEKVFKETGLGFEALATASGPRRLTVHVTGLDARSADVKEERKGPKVGAPEQAVAGFLRGAGLSDISEAEVKSDPKKGDFYVAVIETPGRDATEIVAGAVPEIIRSFHWPKSMRWGTGDLRWVRPLQRIVCVLDGKTVPFDVDGIQSGNKTEGHRVHGRGPYTVTGWDDYKAQLEGKGHVVLSRDDRRATILKGIERVCAENGLEWIEDKGLLEEVTGLAEWPVVILGQMDPEFLSLPPEVIQLSMRVHQKYFAVNDRKTGKLAPNFIVVANIEAADGGKKVAAGNARVLSARLDDGRFFYKTDTDSSLEEMGKKLSTVKFKDELGAIADRVQLASMFAVDLAPLVGADRKLAERAAHLSKSDLVSEMVGEFPELQGVMGRYYALDEGKPAAVADAIRDHYKPQGPSDAVPTEPVSVAVALADKIDTLLGFWLIDEKPTGSKDPFALRRTAIGVVNILLENSIRLPLLGKEVLAAAIRNRILMDLVARRQSATDLGRALNDEFPQPSWGDFQNKAAAITEAATSGLLDDFNPQDTNLENSERLKLLRSSIVFLESRKAMDDLLTFFADRLKQVLRDQGQRHDLIDAVFALGEDDLVLITRRVEALGSFLESDDGATLLEGYKRAANILKAEEKKGALPDDLSVDPALVSKGPKEEQSLYAALQAARDAVAPALAEEDFAAAMGELAKLRAPVYAFFDAVMVNDEDNKVRENRLALLEEVRATLHQVADFSKISG